MLRECDLLTHSFKEWAIAISALSQGKTILLLRKGGISEDKRQFKVKHRKIWLYPTYEHQKPQLLKPEYSNEVTEVASGWHPSNVEIQSCAEITHVLEIDSLATLEKLEPFHIWNRDMVCDRFKWKSQQPLTILLLRVSNLPAPIDFPYHKSYGGCKSWIDLQKPLPLQDLTPILDANTYRDRVSEIIEAI